MSREQVARLKNVQTGAVFAWTPALAARTDMREIWVDAPPEVKRRTSPQPETSEPASEAVPPSPPQEPPGDDGSVEAPFDIHKAPKKHITAFVKNTGLEVDTTLPLPELREATQNAINELNAG